MSPSLTARQEECLRLTRLMTDKEIAAHLGISEPTVKKHVQEACQRFGVNRRKAALALLEQSDAQRAAPSGEPSAPVVASGRIGLWHYRRPPRNALFRLIMIGILALLLAVLVRTLTDFVFNYHGKVGEIDEALTAAKEPRVMVPSVRP